MPSQTRSSAGTIINVGGGVSWSNPDRAAASDNSYARVTIGNNTSAFLRATNWTPAFSIPSNAVFDGIVCECEVHFSIDAFGTPVREEDVFLIVAGASVGNSRPDLSSWAMSDGYKVSGFPTDFSAWGVPTLTPDQVNAADFGFEMKARSLGAGSVIVRVDHMRITVYYTEAGLPTNKRFRGRPGTPRFDRSGTPDAFRSERVMRFSAKRIVRFNGQS